VKIVRNRALSPGTRRVIISWRRRRKGQKFAAGPNGNARDRCSKIYGRRARLSAAPARAIYRGPVNQSRGTGHALAPANEKFITLTLLSLSLSLFCVLLYETEAVAGKFQYTERSERGFGSFRAINL